ncbi:MAG: nucleotidyltransferase family protein [Geminicoccaceae bacterium]
MTGDIAALVLAGQRPEGDPMAAAAGIALKAFLPVAGRPMLERVLDALKGVPAIGRIAVSIPDPGALAGRNVEALATAASPSLSVLAALGHLPPPVLVTTADHALLTPAIIETFLAGADRSEADLVVGVVERRQIEALVPETRRTYWRFRDGAYSGANLFHLRNEQALAAIAFWRRVESERKRPWRIVRAFGPGLLLGYLLRRHSLAEALRRASAVVGCRVAALALPFGEAAIDVDKPADLVLVERLLRARAA